MFLFEYHFNLMRVSFSALFYLCCLSVIDSNKKKAFVFLFLSVLSHLSILVLLPVVIAKLNLRLKNVFYLIISFFIIFLLVYFLFYDIVLYKVTAYELLDFNTGRIPLLVSFILVTIWVGFFMTQKISVAITISLVLFSLFFFYSAFSSIAYRFYMICLLSLLFLVFENKVLNSYGFKLKYFAAGFFVVLFWVSASVIYSAGTERADRLNSGSGNVDFSIVPYSFFYESKYR